jgi:transposase
MPGAGAGRGGAFKAYRWVHRTTNFMPQRAVLFDFCTSRGAEHPQRVLQNFSGTLVTDGCSAHHKRQRPSLAPRAWAQARCKLLKAHKPNASQIAAQAAALITGAIRGPIQRTCSSACRR